MSTTPNKESLPDALEIEAIANEIKAIANQMYSEMSKEQQQQPSLSPIEHQANSISSATNPLVVDPQHLNDSGSQFKFDPITPDAILAVSNYEPLSDVQLQYSISPKVSSPIKASSALSKRETHTREDIYQDRSPLKQDVYTYSPSPLLDGAKGNIAITISAPIKYEENPYSSPFKENTKSDNILTNHKPLDYNDHLYSSSPFKDNIAKDNYTNIYTGIDHVTPSNKQHANEFVSEYSYTNAATSSNTKPIDYVKKDVNYAVFGSTQSSSGATGSTQALSQKTVNAWLDPAASERKTTDYLSNASVSPLKSGQKKPLYDKQKLDGIIQNITQKRVTDSSATRSSAIPLSTPYTTGHNNYYGLEPKSVHQQDFYYNIDSDVHKNTNLNKDLNSYKLTNYTSPLPRPNEGYSQIGRDFVQLKIDTQTSDKTKEGFTPTPFKMEALNATTTPLVEQDTFKYIWQEIGYVPEKSVDIQTNNYQLDAHRYQHTDAPKAHNNQVNDYKHDKYYTPTQYTGSTEHVYATDVHTNKGTAYTNYGGLYKVSENSSFVKEEVLRETLKKNENVLSEHYRGDYAVTNKGWNKDGYKNVAGADEELYRNTRHYHNSDDLKSLRTHENAERTSHQNEGAKEKTSYNPSTGEANREQNPHSSRRKDSEEARNTRHSHKRQTGELEQGQVSSRSERKRSRDLAERHEKEAARVREAEFKENKKLEKMEKYKLEERDRRRSVERGGIPKDERRRSVKEQRQGQAENKKETRNFQNNPNERRSSENRSDRKSSRRPSSRTRDENGRGSNSSRRQSRDNMGSNSRKMSEEVYNKEFLISEGLRTKNSKVEKAYRVNEQTGKLEVVQGIDMKDKLREQERQEEILRQARMKRRVANKTEKAIM